MKTAIDLYQRIPKQYRMPVLAGLAGVIILLLFTGLSLFWALKAAVTIGFKLVVIIVFCALAFKVYSELKKKRPSGNS